MQQLNKCWTKGNGRWGNITKMINGLWERYERGELPAIHCYDNPIANVFCDALCIQADRILNNLQMRTPKAIRLPDLNRKLKKQIGLDKNVMIIFNTKYFHISPERKASEKQALRKEEYKKIPSIIKNARQAILEKGTGDFKLLFDDEQNPHKINKIIFSKTNKGNYILNVSKVDKYNGYDRKKSKVVGEGVAPSI